MGNKKTTQIAAIIALLAIVGSVVGTGILVIVETFTADTQQQSMTQEELNELLKMYSWSLNQSDETVSLSWETISFSGETLPENKE